MPHGPASQGETTSLTGRVACNRLSPGRCSRTARIPWGTAGAIPARELRSLSWPGSRRNSGGRTLRIQTCLIALREFDRPRGRELVLQIESQSARRQSSDPDRDPQGRCCERSMPRRWRACCESTRTPNSRGRRCSRIHRTGCPCWSHRTCPESSRTARSGQFLPRRHLPLTDSPSVGPATGVAPTSHLGSGGQCVAWEAQGLASPPSRLARSRNFLPVTLVIPGGATTRGSLQPCSTPGQALT